MKNDQKLNAYNHSWCTLAIISLECDLTNILAKNKTKSMTSERDVWYEQRGLSGPYDL